MVAAARAVESKKPQNERICYDQFAQYFLGRKFTIFSKSRLLTELALWRADQTTPGSVGCIAGRTRYIDEYLQKCINDGIKQLVILGAGYDSRPYRFNELKDQVKVFEVDHPATQRMKIEKIKKIFSSLPSHVVYVPINFENEKLETRLAESGYNKNLKTLFIWEGVTMYLTAEAVDETLSFVAHNSGRGSSILFNYIFQSVVDGTNKAENANKIIKSYGKRGEPLRFGIEEGTIDKFLSERGFSQIKNVTGKFFKEAYFKGKNTHRNVCYLCGFVYATVKS
jgi:methyltransferase (TIGR00027 family)